jgi:ectoine hydroxylase-related dioxygenase (phytanoyl-CoA dioxygenase family)
VTPIDAATREAYRRDGVACLRGALDAAALREALAAYEWSLANPSPSANTYAGGDGKFYQDLANRRAWPAYARIVTESPAADLVAALWGTPDVWFMYEQVFLKEGGDTRRTPWHQDSSYLPIDGDEIAVMWISFDPVALEHSLEFVRGSQHGPLYDGSRFDPADDTAPLYGDGSLPRLPDIEAERASGRWDVVSFGVEPGDVLVFHPALLHGGAATRSGARRRTLSLRFFGADARYAARPGQRRTLIEEQRATSVFQLLPGVLSPGDAFRHPGFPRVRPRPLE